MHLDWGERLVVELTAGRKPEAVPDPELPPEGSELPPALAEMVDERRKAYAEAVEAARIASLSRLPDQAWREVAARARILGHPRGDARRWCAPAPRSRAARSRVPTPTLE